MVFEERRKLLDDKFEELKTDVVAFTARVTEWMENTKDYRSRLNVKIDKITDRISTLPCDKRQSWYDSIGKQVSFIWAILAIILGAILLEWVKKT